MIKSVITMSGRTRSTRARSVDTAPRPPGNRDGLVWHQRVEIHVMAKRGQVHHRLPSRARLPQRACGAVVVGVADVAPLVELPPPRLGQDRPIRVAQYHHRALDQPFGREVPPLVEGQAVLQGLIHDDLHPIVHGGTHRDPSLEEVLDAEAAGEMLDERHRREQEQQGQGGNRDAHAATRAYRPQTRRTWVRSAAR